MPSHWKQHLFIRIFIFCTNRMKCFEIPIKKAYCQYSTASEVVRWQYGKARYTNFVYVILKGSHIFNLILTTIAGGEWPRKTTHWRRFKIGGSRDNGRKCSNYLHNHTDRAASITRNKATLFGADREEYGKAFLVWSSGMYCTYIMFVRWCREANIYTQRVHSFICILYTCLYEAGCSVSGWYQNFQKVIFFKIYFLGCR